MCHGRDPGRVAAPRRPRRTCCRAELRLTYNAARGITTPAGSALLGLIALSPVLSALSPNFLTVANLMNVARQTRIIGIVAVGMTQ